MFVVAVFTNVDVLLVLNKPSSCVVLLFWDSKLVLQARTILLSLRCGRSGQKYVLNAQ